MKRKTVLLIDDDKDSLYLISAVLTQHGFEVFTLVSAERIVQSVSEIEPDVILLDQKMSPISGDEAVTLLKADSRVSHVPVILFSAFPDIEEIAAGCGADGFMRKPFDFFILELLISRLIGVI